MFGVGDSFESSVRGQLADLAFIDGTEAQLDHAMTDLRDQGVRTSRDRNPTWAQRTADAGRSLGHVERSDAVTACAADPAGASAGRAGYGET